MIRSGHEPEDDEHEPERIEVLVLHRIFAATSETDSTGKPESTGHASTIKLST